MIGMIAVVKRGMPNDLSSVLSSATDVELDELNAKITYLIFNY